MRSLWVVLTILLLISAASLLQPYDDTDNAEEGERSGFRLYTDHGTGCQYLRAGVFGGVVPRFDRDGNQVCGRSAL